MLTLILTLATALIGLSAHAASDSIDLSKLREREQYVYCSSPDRVHTVTAAFDKSGKLKGLLADTKNSDYLFADLKPVAGNPSLGVGPSTHHKFGANATVELNVAKGSLFVISPAGTVVFKLSGMACKTGSTDPFLAN